MRQDQDFEYFIQNIEAFYKQYGHKFLAIKDRNILGAYDSFNTALEETLKQEQIGTFIIQECFKNKEESVTGAIFNVMAVPA
jgi:fibrillarin-like rRNA methylase